MAPPLAQDASSSPPIPPCTRAQGTAGERVTAFFIGGAPRLRHEEVIYTPGDRFRLQTTARGVVHLQLGILMKDFEKNNVQLG